MKLLFGIFLLAFCCLTDFAQGADAEKDFEKNRLKYKLEKFAEGEDASSGYDYLVYSSKAGVVKIREIWSSSAGVSTYRAEDYFFRDGKLVALVKYTFAKKYYNTAKKGTKVQFKPVEKLYFTDSKLTGWTENGKTIPTTDARWQTSEKDALELARGVLETCKQLKEERN
jgi:hypothetical protein